MYIVDHQIREDLGDKNKEAAKKWKEMSEKEKQHYQQIAAQVPCPSEGKFDKWHETQRILSNLQDNVSRCCVLSSDDA